MSDTTPDNFLRFTKMQGAGNDFVVINNSDDRFTLDELIELTPKLCDRKFGVGADGLLALSPSDTADYTMVYRNADGSDAGMCGNGARCIAAFAERAGFKRLHHFEIHGNKYKAEVGNSFVEIHFPIEVSPEKLGLIEDLELIKTNSATEHVVTFTTEENLRDESFLVVMGRKIRNREDLFPTGTNVNFVSVEKDHVLKLQTYERGVENLTLACGTGAIASAISWVDSRIKNVNDDENENKPVVVNCKGGSLHVSYTFNDSKNVYSNIILKGSAEFVFEGIWPNK